jgi:hypothetical protein
MKLSKQRREFIGSIALAVEMFGFARVQSDTPMEELIVYYADDDEPITIAEAREFVKEKEAA